MMLKAIILVGCAIASTASALEGDSTTTECMATFDAASGSLTESDPKFCTALQDFASCLALAPGGSDFLARTAARLLEEVQEDNQHCGFSAPTNPTMVGHRVLLRSTVPRSRQYWRSLRTVFAARALPLTPLGWLPILTPPPSRHASTGGDRTSTSFHL
jgi:hypothetical protein